MSYRITTGAEDDLVYSEASEEQVSSIVKPASGLSSFRVQNLLISQGEAMSQALPVSLFNHIASLPYIFNVKYSRHCRRNLRLRCKKLHISIYISPAAVYTTCNP